MKDRLKRIVDSAGLKGIVRNHSSQVLWVVETSTKRPKFNAVAHLLVPGYKTPEYIDADGLKRLDGKSIAGHKSWWKIPTGATADVLETGSDLWVIVSYKMKVEDKEFGDVYFDYNEGWGRKMKYVSAVRKGRNNSVSQYFVEGMGWLGRSKAVALTKKASSTMQLL